MEVLIIAAMSVVIAYWIIRIIRYFLHLERSVWDDFVNVSCAMDICPPIMPYAIYTKKRIRKMISIMLQDKYDNEVYMRNQFLEACKLYVKNPDQLEELFWEMVSDLMMAYNFGMRSFLVNHKVEIEDEDDNVVMTCNINPMISKLINRYVVSFNRKVGKDENWDGKVLLEHYQNRMDTLDKYDLS